MKVRSGSSCSADVRGRLPTAICRNRPHTHRRGDVVRLRVSLSKYLSYTSVNSHEQVTCVCLVLLAAIAGHATSCASVRVVSPPLAPTPSLAHLRPPPTAAPEMPDVRPTTKVSVRCRLVPQFRCPIHVTRVSMA